MAVKRPAKSSDRAGAGPKRVGPKGVGALTKRDRAVALIVTAARRLTASRGRTLGQPAIGRGKEMPRILVACSGGADSSALVLALATVGWPMVVGHVVHDLRSKKVAEGDAAKAEELAKGVGAEFVSTRVQVKASKGNAEGNARAVRYAALAKMAREHGCLFVATGHHMGDQAETVLMRLARGSGPRGLRGVLASRVMSEEGDGNTDGTVRVIRPMLGVGGGESRRLCRAAGWVWTEDATNAEQSLVRNVIRAEVMPRLERVVPGAAERLAGAAEMFAEVEADTARRARAVWKRSGRSAKGAASVDGRALVRSGRLVALAVLRRMFEEVVGVAGGGGGGGAKSAKLKREHLMGVVSALEERAYGRVITWPGGGVRVRFERSGAGKTLTVKVVARVGARGR